MTDVHYHEAPCFKPKKWELSDRIGFYLDGEKLATPFRLHVTCPACIENIVTVTEKPTKPKRKKQK